MKRIKEYVNEMTKQGWITLSAIGLLVIIVAIWLVVFYMKNPSAWPMTYFGKDEPKITDIRVENKVDEEGDLYSDNFVDTATEYAFNKGVEEGVSTNQYAFDPKSPSSYASAYQHVKIALIIEENEYEVKNVISGTCGNVYMITAYMPGPAFLTNSLEALFGNKVFADFLPGNIIPTYHPNLTLEDVKIENGIAKIYLGGTFSGKVNGACDTELALAQLRETAKSYPTVQSVQIYQNGDLIK